MEQVDGDARAERVAGAVQGGTGDIGAARRALDELLVAEPAERDISPEQAELRRALGVL